MRRNSIYSLFVIIAILFFTFSTQTINAQTVAINEILYDADDNDGQSSGTGEWVELYGTPDMDLGCYMISDGDFVIVIPSGTTMPADGFLVIGNATYIGNNGNAADVDIDIETCGCNSAGNAMVLTNSGEFLSLYDPIGNLIDGVIFGENVDGNNNGPNGQVLTPTNPTGCDNGDLTIPSVADYDNPPAPWTYIGDVAGNGE